MITLSWCVCVWGGVYGHVDGCYYHITMPTLGNENDLFTLKCRKRRRQFASSESTFKLLLLLLLLLLHSFNVPQVTKEKVFWMMQVDVVVIMGISVESFQRCRKSARLDCTEEWPLMDCCLPANIFAWMDGFYVSSTVSRPSPSGIQLMLLRCVMLMNVHAPFLFCSASGEKKSQKSMKTLWLVVFFRTVCCRTVKVQ